ncbi:hypothetical protein [Duganella levis]|uniref:Apea-like HEPN domain-containing protein n=1 Tax=Duganella levis TaxID=2692169 RepID=A0ABW9W3A6_9BURK|nr:hypothetical protein [Duganella levis]MYN28443.1 hypothetical protein [Duganella levis]
MPTFRVDIRVKSEIVFPTSDDFIVVEYLDSKYKITLRNAPALENKIVRSLDATIMGEAESMDEVGHDFRAILARWLDNLAYVCQCSLVIEKVWRVVEWEPGQKKRKFKALNVLDKFPETILSGNIIKTANALAQSDLPPHVRRALQCFRTALLLFSQEDRFMQFWTAVEVLANGSKEKKSIPIPCGECGGAISCKSCGDSPTRVPMATQAIRDLFFTIGVPDAGASFKLLSKVRHGITHGRTNDSIEAETGQSLADAVQLMGMVACNMVRKFVPEAIFDFTPTFKSCGGPYLSGQLIGGPLGEFEQPEGQDFPDEASIPDVKIDLIIVDESSNHVSNIKVTRANGHN